jgi:hypothetical protein
VHREDSAQSKILPKSKEKQLQESISQAISPEPKNNETKQGIKHLPP